MDYLNWELSILSRAVAHKNLSTAAQHIHISQPQLSRIIAKLEHSFEMTLLDRDAKRKSGWTPSAFDLANLYSKTFKQFQKSVDVLSRSGYPDHIAIGVLEGLAPLGVKLARHCFEKLKFQAVELDVYDQNDIENSFLRGDLQVILSSRTPGLKKYKFMEHLGYQSLTKVKSSDPFAVMSPFEFATSLHGVKKKKSASQLTFVSNSLALRRFWLDNHGGNGLVPSELYRRKKETENELEVLLIAEETLSPKLWEHLVTFPQG